MSDEANLNLISVMSVLGIKSSKISLTWNTLAFFLLVQLTPIHPLSPSNSVQHTLPEHVPLTRKCCPYYSWWGAEGHVKQGPWCAAWICLDCSRPPDFSSPDLYSASSLGQWATEWTAQNNPLVFRNKILDPIFTFFHFISNFYFVFYKVYISTKIHG